MPPESTLERIHQAARQEFRERGFHGASLRSIVKSVGMTTGAFYGYYKGKEELFAALVGEHYSYLLARFRRAQEEFARLPYERQPEVLSDLSGVCMFDMLHYAYAHLEDCQLLLCSAEGTRFASPTLEYSYKNDALGDPLINSYHAIALGAASRQELDTIADYALRINEILKGYLAGFGIDLIDFKLEFGRLPDGTIVLADEISPDTCRFWDAKTGAHLDKDLFRRDLGGEEEAYREVLSRLLGE